MIQKNDQDLQVLVGGPSVYEFTGEKDMETEDKKSNWLMFYAIYISPIHFGHMYCAPTPI